jgi:hypothetical protein
VPHSATGSGTHVRKSFINGIGRRIFSDRCDMEFYATTSRLATISEKIALFYPRTDFSFQKLKKIKGARLNLFFLPD